MDQALAGTTMLPAAASLFLQKLHPSSIVRVHCGNDGLIPPRFVTAYWSIRGLGASIRMLLGATMIPHWVLLYDDVETAEEEEEDHWMADKTWLSNEVSPFINLPYLVDLESNGEAPTMAVISQSNAILLYLDRVIQSSPQHSPGATAVATTATTTTSMVEQLLMEIMDLRNAMIAFAYHPATTEAALVADGVTFLRERVRPYLQRWEKYVESIQKRNNNRATDDETYCCYLIQGRRPSAPDYHLFEMIDQLHGLGRRVLGDDEYTTLFGPMNDDDDDSSSSDAKVVAPSLYPHLRQFWRSFRRHPVHRSYLASILYQQLPYNSASARFGSDVSPLRSYVPNQALTPWRNLGVVDIP
jgi:hypothetical protein